MVKIQKKRFFRLVHGDADKCFLLAFENLRPCLGVVFLEHTVFGFRVGKNVNPADVAVLEIKNKFIDLNADMAASDPAEFFRLIAVSPAADRTVNDADNDVLHWTKNGWCIIQAK